MQFHVTTRLLGPSIYFPMDTRNHEKWSIYFIILPTSIFSHLEMMLKRWMSSWYFQCSSNISPSHGAKFLNNFSSFSICNICDLNKDMMELVISWIELCGMVMHRMIQWTWTHSLSTMGLVHSLRWRSSTPLGHGWQRCHQGSPPTLGHFLMLSWGMGRGEPFTTAVARSEVIRQWMHTKAHNLLQLPFSFCLTSMKLLLIFFQEILAAQHWAILVSTWHFLKYYFAVSL